MVAMEDAGTLREQGNDLFRRGEYDSAIKVYTEAFDLLDGKSSETAAVVLKNRAACQLKLGQYESVIDDINLTISMGGGDSKAYYRRSVAHQNLKQLDKALKDAMEAVRIDPKNKAAIDLVMAIRKDIQNRKDIMSSTTGLVDEMLGSLRDEEADLDKKTRAMKNLVHVTTTSSGCETLVSKNGVQDILRYLHHDTIQIHTLNCIICLLRDSIKRTHMILEMVPLQSSLKILVDNKEAARLIGGVLYEMLNSALEDRGYDYTKRVMGQNIKKFPIPALFPKLFKYLEECCEVAEDSGLDSLINALVRCTDSRVLVEELLHKNMIKFLLNLVVQGKLSYSYSQQLSIVISRVWARARVNDKWTLAFVKQCSSLISPRLLSGENKNQMLALRTLNVVLQGSFEAGGDVIRDSAELYRVVSKLLCSMDKDVQCTAAESVALMCSDKKMCYNLADQNFNLLKTLYKTPDVDDSVKLRALVGMSKMCASSGGDVHKKITAEGAGHRLHKQIRHYLLKTESTEENRKWAIEALAYLTIDAEVKHDVVNDEAQMKRICDMSVTVPDPGTAYSLSCVFMNMTNSYEKPDIQPEMVRIAQFAKQSVPEEHEFDNEEHLKTRIQQLVKYGVPTVLAACSSADSERTREFLARSYFGIVDSAAGEHCGAVVQLGGTRALLQLFSDNSIEGKRIAAHAIAKIAIKMNPALAFSGQRSLDACRPCISLIKSTMENTFLVYDGLMALTNLASVSDSVRERILREGGCHHVEYQQLEDNEALRRAATQCVCNMALNKKIQERYRPAEDTPEEPADRLKMILVLCGDEDYHTRIAALGAVAYFTADVEVCKSLLTIGSFVEVIKETIVFEDAAIRHRVLIVLQNLLASDKSVAEQIIQTEIFECLLALQQMSVGKELSAALENCMKAARFWGLIQENPGDMVYTTAQ